MTDTPHPPSASAAAEQAAVAVNELVGNLACCAYYGCRCWQAGEYLAAIRDYAASEHAKTPHAAAQSAPPAPHHALLKAQLVANEHGLAAGIGSLMSPPAPKLGEPIEHDGCNYLFFEPQEAPVSPSSSASSFAERARVLSDEIEGIHADFNGPYSNLKDLQWNYEERAKRVIPLLAAFAQQIRAETFGEVIRHFEDETHGKDVAAEVRSLVSQSPEKEGRR